MSFLWRAGASLLSLLLVAAAAWAQATGSTNTPPAKGSTSSPSGQSAPAAGQWKRYCLEGGGFCFDRPAAWKELGPVFNGAGVVFAQPMQGRPQSDWSQITAAVMPMPEPANGSERPELDDLINHVLTADPSGKVHTVQRTNTLVAGHPTQIVTTQVEEPGKPPAAEQVAFIDAEDALYTLALRCLPSEFSRMQPIFLRALKSWSEAPQSSEPPVASPKPK